MFELLKSISRADFVEAVYRVGLRLYEREAFPDWRRWLTLRPDNRLSECALASAVAVLEEIEQDAQTPIDELTDAQVRHYNRLIGRISDERDRRELRVDPARAKAALEEMRRLYGAPGCHAVA